MTTNLTSTSIVTASSTLRQAFALAAAVLGIATLGTPHARAQARLTFSGGLGTPLTLTLKAPVTYAVTTAGSANNAPIFAIQGIGNVFNFIGVGYNGSGTLTFTVKGGAAQPLSLLGSGFTGNDVAPTDGFLEGSEPGVSIGDTVVLNAGTYTTANNYAAAPPANGSYPTFLFDSPGTRLDAVDGVAAPEPSAWALLVLGGVGLLGLILRQRRTIFPG